MHVHLLSAVLLSACLPADGPEVTSPLDELRRRRAALKVRLDYEYRCGFIESDGAFTWDRLLDTGYRPVPETGWREMWVVGRWETDGRSVHMWISSLPETLALIDQIRAKAKLAGKDGFRHPGRTPTEMLHDDRLGVTYSPGQMQVLGVWDIRDCSPVTDSHGPFGWSSKHFFSTYLERWEGVEPQVFPATGNALPKMLWHGTAILQGKPFRGNLLIEFDPARGWLPRRIQYAIRFPTLKDSIYCGMTVVRDSQEVGAGRFVPTDWLDITGSMPLDAVRLDEPRFFDPTLMEEGTVGVSGFRASEVRPFTGEPTLTTEGPVGSIFVAAERSSVKIKPAQEFTFDQVMRAIAGTVPAPANPFPAPQALAVDRDEADRYDAEPPRSPWWYAGGAVLLAAAIGFAVWLGRGVRDRRAAGLLVLGILHAGTVGCHQAPPESVPISPALEAAISPQEVVGDDMQAVVDGKLTLLNRSRETIRIDKLAGTCSCGLPDETAMPLVIEPGTSRAVPLKLHLDSSYVRREYSFLAKVAGDWLPVVAYGTAVPKHDLRLGGTVQKAGRDRCFRTKAFVRTVLPPGTDPIRLGLTCEPAGTAELLSTEKTPSDGGKLVFHDSVYLCRFRHAQGLEAGVGTVKLTGPAGHVIDSATTIWSASAETSALSKTDPSQHR